MYYMDYKLIKRIIQLIKIMPPKKESLPTALRQPQKKGKTIKKANKQEKRVFLEKKPQKVKTFAQQRQDIFRGKLKSMNKLFQQSQNSECPICLSLTVDPVMLDCGHIFCCMCFDSTCITDIKCSVCRKPTQINPFFFFELETFIRKQKVFNNKEESLIYWERQEINDEWQKQRQINQAQIRRHSMIDIHFGNAWREGRIIKVKILKTKVVYTVEVIVNDTKRLIDVNSSSRQLANHQFYTKENHKKINGANYHAKFIQANLGQQNLPVRNKNQKKINQNIIPQEMMANYIDVDDERAALLNVPEPSIADTLYDYFLRARNYLMGVLGI